MFKCIGCGSKLQNESKDLLGYTSNIDNNLCERCFRIKNYNDYKLVSISNTHYINILKNISNTNKLIVLVVDIFNIPKDILNISKLIKNNILLVITKRDILPKSLKDNKLINYFNNYNLNIIDSVIVSSNKNYNLDLLYEKINKYKTDYVYFVGFTNSGKSTLINKLLYNYYNKEMLITTSSLPSTTIDSIEIKINENLTLVDTPGLLDSGDIINYIDGNLIKKIIPKKEIKPKTLQLKNKQYIYIEDLVVLEIPVNTNFTIFMSNNLNITKKKKLDLNYNKKEIYLDSNNDLVIQGLGFIKFSNKVKVNIYLKNNFNVFTRKNLI